MSTTTTPQVGDQVQITIGLDKGKRFTVIGVYSDQVELGEENGKFIRSASAVICTVCPPPAANTNGESLAARAAGGQGADTLQRYLCCTHCDWSGYSDELEADRSIGFEGGLCPECFSHCVGQS